MKYIVPIYNPKNADGGNITEINIPNCTYA